MPGGKEKGSHHGREKKVHSNFQAAGSRGAVKKRYEGGELIEGPTQSEKVLLARNAELERMVGRLTMENELLKKAVQYTVRRRRENSSPITAKSLGVSRGGAK